MKTQLAYMIFVLATGVMIATASVGGSDDVAKQETGSGLIAQVEALRNDCESLRHKVSTLEKELTEIRKIVKTDGSINAPYVKTNHLILPGKHGPLLPYRDGSHVQIYRSGLEGCDIWMKGMVRKHSRVSRPGGDDILVVQDLFDPPPK